MQLWDLKSRSYFGDTGNYLKRKFNYLMLFSLKFSCLCFHMSLLEDSDKEED